VPPLAAQGVSIDDGHKVGATYWPAGDTSDGGQGQDVAGLSCGTMDESYHVHTHVSLFFNGSALTLPQHVGIVATSPTANCFYSIHTHDETGKVHIEAPAPAKFTLGQLFSIWGQPLATNNIAGLMDMPVRIFIVDTGDTEATEYTGDFKEIELTSHRGITIQVGTPIAEIPTFSWSGT
jgi:hypothetical protein